MVDHAKAQAFVHDAREAFEQGRLRDALQLCDRAALLSVGGRYEAAVLRGDILLSMGDPAGALSCYESVADVSIPDPTLDCVRGQALFLLGRLAEADNALRSSLNGPVELARAHHTLGLIAEITKSGEEVAHFRRARQLDPKRFPPRPRVSADAFRAAVNEAIEGLPQTTQLLLREVPVLVADFPTADDLARYGTKLSPLALGLVVGVLEPSQLPIEDLETIDLGLLLYRRNFERRADLTGTLVENIRQTIVDELGHAASNESSPSPEIVD